MEEKGRKWRNLFLDEKNIGRKTERKQMHFFTKKNKTEKEQKIKSKNKRKKDPKIFLRDRKWRR